MKKGVKRKADTTTPTANSFDPLFTPMESKSAKISTRRESGRQIKKVIVLLFYLFAEYIAVYSVSCFVLPVSCSDM